MHQGPPGGYPSYAPQQQPWPQGSAPPYQQQQLPPLPGQQQYHPQQYPSQQPQYPPAGAGYGQAPHPPQQGLCLTQAQHCRPEARVLTLKERLVSLGDAYTMTEAGGKEAFTCETKLFSKTKKRVLKDAQGRVAGELCRKAIGGREAWAILSHEDRVLALVHEHATQWDKRIDLALTDGRTLVVTGGVNARAFALELNGARLATITKAGVVGRKGVNLTDTYELALQPHVDAAFVALVAVLLDQLFHE